MQNLYLTPSGAEISERLFIPVLSLAHMGPKLEVMLVRDAESVHSKRPRKRPYDQPMYSVRKKLGIRSIVGGKLVRLSSNRQGSDEDATRPDRTSK